MIQTIGIKRIVILMLLIGANVLLAASIYLYSVPQNMVLERKLRTLKTEVSAVSVDLERIKVNFEKLEEQQGQFDELKESGFFSTQVRSEAKKLFSEIQEESKVISAIANVKSGTIVDSAEAKKANHKILRSPISVELKAFDDLDIYKYISLVKETFPGHVSLESFKILRTRDINSATIRAISSGSNPELVNAKIRFSWRTLIPDSQVIMDGSSK